VPATTTALSFKNALREVISVAVYFLKLMVSFIRCKGFVVYAILAAVNG